MLPKHDRMRDGLVEAYLAAFVLHAPTTGSEGADAAFEEGRAPELVVWPGAGT